MGSSISNVAYATQLGYNFNDSAVWYCSPSRWIQNWQTGIFREYL